MNFQEMQVIVDNISYKLGWKILCKRNNKSRPFIQISFDYGIDSVTFKSIAWKSGKVYLSEFMCTQEIVGAVFGLIQATEMHEMREFFRYKGVRIYNPHLCPDKLVDFANDESNINIRKNAMNMDESL